MPLLTKPMNFSEKWISLQETVNSVLALKHVPKNVWNESFDDIYFLCVAFPSLSDKLYDHIKMCLEEHVLGLLSIIQTENTSNILQIYLKLWHKYGEGVKYLHYLFQYLNSNHVKNTKLSDTELAVRIKTPDFSDGLEIGELGFHVWKQNIIEPLKTNIFKSLLVEIEKHRYNTPTATSLDIIVDVINSFIVVGESNKKHPLEVYQTYFELPFLEKSVEYFKYESARLLQECPISEYMVKVLQIFKEEEILLKKYLHSSSYTKVRDRFYKHMVGDHLEFLHGACEAIVKEERKDDLINMYCLLREVGDGLNSLIVIFGEHMKQHGIGVIKSLNKKQVYIHYVEELSALRTKYKSMIENLFHGDSMFNNILDIVFAEIINYQLEKNQKSKSPEYFAKYYDYLLTNLSKKLSEAEIDEKLLQSINITRYIDDRDVFQKLFEKQMTKRLLCPQRQSKDLEEEIVHKMKEIFGYEFTTRLYKMLTDVGVSEKLNKDFHDTFRLHENKLDITFYTHVLQDGNWPFRSSSVSSIVIPKQLTLCMELFEKFYKSKYSGRNLTWVNHHSQGELKLNYLQQEYIITMQMTQMAILLLFENQDVLKLSEIHELLQLDNDQLKIHINNLVKSELLLTNGDNISLNMNYNNKHTKFSIIPAIQKDTPQKIEKTIKSVEMDRKMFLQAAIIRIMKIRKVLPHYQLVKDVLPLSKAFTPSIAAIKEAIETLIEKEYLVRTENQLNSYSYVA